MKTIGIVGGTTWYSTIDYYRYMNELTNKSMGGDEAAKIIMYSVNYGEIKKLTQADNWAEITKIISNAAINIQNAGAEVVILGANTMHHIYEEVERSLNIPMIHIADAVANEIKKMQLKKVALLGTKYTMTFPFFPERLKSSGIETVIPDEKNIEMVNLSIYNELGKGLILPETKKYYLELIEKLKKEGAEGVILGCTEIPLLIKQSDCDIPVFDTALIHSKAAVEFALS